jgi:transcriptional regulator with XRE-family HTH domain
MALPSDVFRARLREVRRFKGWTQQQLASALADVGVDLGEPAVTRLERGARGVSLDDVIAIAAVLGVSPLHMIVPLENDVTADLAPQLPAPVADARAWFRGQRPLRESDDLPLFYAQTPPDDWDVIEAGSEKLKAELQVMTAEDFEALRLKWEREIYRRMAAQPGSGTS